jgi:predicted esterase
MTMLRAFQAMASARRILVALFVLAPALAIVASSSVAWAKTARPIADPSRLEVPGYPDAYYYRPRNRGLRPVLMYLHGRGGNPGEDCRKWAKVGTQFGWVVCPQGPEDRGGGARSWLNSAQSGKEIMDATLHALREQFGHRVQTRQNVLIGFSEGAFVAMQVGLRDPKTWSRWLILAANDQYWFGDTEAILKEDRRKFGRIYLLTGENDEVAENTEKVGEMLKKAKIPTRVKIVPGLGHEIPADRMVTTYRRPLLWLTR